MTSTLNSRNTSAKGSKLPISIPNTDASAVREDVSSTQAKKPPYEARKSAEELKLRLASAVSAKIALGKDGRNSSSNTTNRGIGFLLQRNQQENRLNTKDISFQKPVHNRGGKPVEMMAKNPNNSTKSVNKAELQKSLLSALMNSRGTSAASLGQLNRGKDTRSKLNSDTKGKTSANELNKTPVLAPKLKKTSENVAIKSSNGTISEQNSNSRFVNGTKLVTSTANEGQASASEFNNKPLSTVNPKSGNLPSKLPLESSNVARGGILDRAKNIERLLGQRKRENIPVELMNATKAAAVNGKEKITEPKKGITSVNDKSNRNFDLNGTALAAKPVENGKKGIPILNGRNNWDGNLNKMVKTTNLLGSLGKEGDTVLNGRNNAVFKLNKTLNTVENGGEEKATSSNGKNNGQFSVNKTVESRKPFENFGKKIPPPVAKKPSKEDLNRSKQAAPVLDVDKQKSLTLAKGKNVSSNGKISSQNETRSTTGITPSQTQGKTGTLKVNGLHSKNETAFLALTNSGKGEPFREDLLEKLEADVGSCKIAAFQSMEDFSALRMKVYGIRGELDQLKRDREKRTPLVC